MEIRDDRCQPWAWFDHTIIDEYAMKIGPFGIAVYMALVRYANNNDQTCYPSYETLQERLGFSRRSVARAIEILVEYGLIAKEQRRAGPKGRQTNIYRIRRTPAPSRRLVHERHVLDEVSAPGELTSNVTESLIKVEVSAHEELTVSAPGELTQPVSAPGELTVSAPGRLEQDLVVKELKENPLTPLQGESAPEVPVKQTRRRKVSPELPQHAPEAFARFYRAYPKHKNPDDAMKAWDIRKPDASLQEVIITNVEARAKDDPEWIKDRGTFVPYPATYLRNARWKDEWKSPPPKYVIN